MRNVGTGALARATGAKHRIYFAAIRAFSASTICGPS